MIIQFNVEFPKKGQIDTKKISALENILPPRIPVDIPLNAEEHTLVEIDPSYRNRRNYEDMEEDMPQGARRVQCANQ